MVRSLIVFVLLVLGTSTGHAQSVPATCGGQTYMTAPDGRNFCEQHWSGEAQCTGSDQLPLGAGPIAPSTPIVMPIAPGPGGFVTPWEPAPITIKKVTTVFQPWGTRPDPFSYVFAGNSYTHDVMAWSNPSDKLTNTDSFPDGHGFQFPGSANALAHIDLHVMCNPVGLWYQVYLIVYYEVNAASASTVATK